MRKSGYYDLLLKRINDYFRARANKRKHADGSLETLKRLMKTGLSEDNLPLSLTRKYCRLFTAYNEGKDIIQADAWMRKHRSHRGHSVLMDNRLEQLYYPYGREEEVIDIDNDDHIITADDILLVCKD